MLYKERFEGWKGRSIAAAWFTIASVCGHAAVEAGNNPFSIGLDHIPLAVRDLDTAASSYRQLGFSLKPGRFHANSIRNQHVKFPDGTGIELLTADEPLDPLATEYLRLIKQGEGPAFLILHTKSLKSIAEELERRQLSFQQEGGLISLKTPSLSYLAFAEGDNRSPTDRPEHFSHANKATKLVGVWIADDDNEPLFRLLTSLRIATKETDVEVPDKMRAHVAFLENGELIVMPPSWRRLPGRSIVGAILETTDLGAVENILSNQAGIGFQRQQDETFSRVIVPPNSTHGIWLEFRQRKAAKR